MSVRIINADVLEGLAQIPDESVQCVVTSPPYWGLRDYGTGSWEGGHAGCDHVKGQMRRGLGLATSAASTRGGGKKAAEISDIPFGQVCGKCGAVRVDRQIGIEPTLHDHLAKLVAVFREVRRVMRPDATLWLNYGDAYAGSGRGGNPTEASSTLQGGHSSQRASMVKRSRAEGEIGATARVAAQTNTSRRATIGGLHEKQIASGSIGRAWCPPTDGFKLKDLMLMPERLAIALQDDGWWVRSRIIWAKPNPMPESVTDRPTKSHEHIWLLTRGERYFYDADAIKEPASYVGPNTPGSIKSPHGQGFTRRARGNSDGFRGGSYVDGKIGDRKGVGNVPAADLTRNCRDVWTIATTSFGEAHFATFPAELAERCIKAGCPAGGMVLDPFGGAGTTGLVADRLGRHATLIEINPEYAAMAERRIRGDAPLLAEVET